jgi:hypothetical protein
MDFMVLNINVFYEPTQCSICCVFGVMVGTFRLCTYSGYLTASQQSLTPFAAAIQLYVANFPGKR